MDLATDRLRDRLDRIDALSKHLSFRISRLAKLLEADGQARLADSDLTLAAYRILLVTDALEPVSVTDVGKVTLIDRGQISRTSNELIRKGLIKPVADPRNQRKKLLTLTQQGRNLFQEAKVSFDSRDQELRDTLATDQLQALWQAIDLASRALEERLDSR